MALIGKKIAGAVAPVGAVALYKGTKHSNDEDEAIIQDKDKGKEQGKKPYEGYPSVASEPSKAEVLGEKSEAAKDGNKTCGNERHQHVEASKRNKEEGGKADESEYLALLREMH